MNIEVDDPPILIAANAALKALRMVLAVLIAVALAFGIPAATADVLASGAPVNSSDWARALGWIFRSPAATTVIVGLLVQGALGLRAGQTTPMRASMLLATGVCAILMVGSISLWALGDGALGAVSPDMFSQAVHLSALGLFAAVLLLVRS